MVKSIGVARADCLVCVVDVPPGETDPERYCIAAAHAALPCPFSDHELRLELLRHGIGRHVRRVGLCVLLPKRTPTTEASAEGHLARGRATAETARETTVQETIERRRPALARPWQDERQRVGLPVHQAMVECRRGTAIYHRQTGDAGNLILVHDGLPVADSLVWNAAALPVEAVRLQHLAVGRGWNCGDLRAFPETTDVRRRRLTSRGGGRQTGRRPGSRLAAALILVIAAVIAEVGLALRRGGTCSEAAAGAYTEEPRSPAGGSSAATDASTALSTGLRGDLAGTPAREVTEPTLADQLATVARTVPDGLVVKTVRYGDGAFFIEATAPGMDSLAGRADGEAGFEILRASAVDGTDQVLVEAGVVPWP